MIIAFLTRNSDIIIYDIQGCQPVSCGCRNSVCCRPASHPLGTIYILLTVCPSSIKIRAYPPRALSQHLQESESLRSPRASVAGTARQAGLAGRALQAWQAGQASQAGQAEQAGRQRQHSSKQQALWKRINFTKSTQRHPDKSFQKTNRNAKVFQ